MHAAAIGSMEMAGDLCEGMRVGDGGGSRSRGGGIVRPKRLLFSPVHAIAGAGPQPRVCYKRPHWLCFNRPPKREIAVAATLYDDDDDILLFVMLVFLLVLFGSLALSILIVVPLTGALVRVRANFNPKSIQLDAEGNVEPHTGPDVTTFFGMLRRVKRIEVSRAIFAESRSLRLHHGSGVVRPLQGSQYVLSSEVLRV